MFIHLGYYVTESSGHNSEYNWWFRKRPDLIEKYCTHGTGWNPGKYAYIVEGYKRRKTTWRRHIRNWLTDPKPLNLKRGREYAASIKLMRGLMVNLFVLTAMFLTRVS